MGAADGFEERAVQSPATVLTTRPVRLPIGVHLNLIRVRRHREKFKKKRARRMHRFAPVQRTKTKSPWFSLQDMHAEVQSDK